MGGTVEINESGMTINFAGGGGIAIGNWGVKSDQRLMEMPPLTPDEEKYGRGLCLLPLGWKELTGDANWQHHLSAELRKQWPTLSLEQKMAIAFTIGELSDELSNRACEHAW
nr:MAG TPA: hypothetical protein [Caudoviricetes sp.]